MQSYQPPTGKLFIPATQLPSVSTGEPTFKEQAEIMLARLATRSRKPVHASTLFTWQHYLDHRIYSAIGYLPLRKIKNSTIKPLIAAMVDSGLKATYINAHFRLIKMVVESFVDAQGDPVYSRNWNLDFLDLPIIQPRTLNWPCFSDDIVGGLAL